MADRDNQAQPKPKLSPGVRKAAAEAAVAAGKRSGRPVDPRVKAIAES
ncbi:hypothetical protein [Mycolicibacterium llatzerense]|nr:hypothetical protein [Mycolicibacterium llatzerense]